MKCTLVKIGGNDVFACGGVRLSTCACGKIATRLCDWKTGTGRTCDTGICDDCATSPAEGKDLCTRHAKVWAEHPGNKQQELSL